MGNKQYKAFISYSHADARWAQWIHHALERYRVPARLLADLVSPLPGAEKVDLELQGTDTLHLRSGRFATHIKGIAVPRVKTLSRLFPGTYSITM